MGFQCAGPARRVLSLFFSSTVTPLPERERRVYASPAPARAPAPPFARPRLLSPEPLLPAAAGARAIHGVGEGPRTRRRRRRARPAERAAGLPPPHHHVLPQGPAGGADVRAGQALEAPLVLGALPRYRPRRVHGRYHTKVVPDPDGNAGLGSDSSDDDDDSSDDDNDSSDDDGDVVKNREWEWFEGFTMNLMRRCNIAQLESFKMHIGGDRAPSFGGRRAAGWLLCAMKYCTPGHAPHHQGLSSCSWLLKRLHLCNVRLDDRFVELVHLVCHSLEDMKLEECRCGIQSIISGSLKTLILKNCRWRNLSKIASPTLKTLIIDGGSNPYRCRLVILAPAVTYLHLAINVGHFCRAISLNEMSSLTKASIHLHGQIIYGYNNKFYDDQFKLLCSVANVTSLELSEVGTTVLGKKPTFQEFKNLWNLVLTLCDLRDDFRTLRFFLQSSPNLEKLTLRYCQFPKQNKGTPELNQASSSEFRGLDSVCENLKVEIIYKNGRAAQLVKLLLRASGNLSKSNIKLTKVT